MSRNKKKTNNAKNSKNKVSKKVQQLKNMNFSKKVLTELKTGIRVHPFHSVGGKILATFFVSIVLCVLLSGLISYRISENVIKDKTSESMQQTMIMTSEKLDMIYDKYETDTGLFINDSDLNNLLAEYVEADMKERVMLQRTLDQRVSAIMYADSSIAGIHIIDPKGYVLQSFGSTSFVERDLSGEEWLAAIVEQAGRPYWLETRKEGYSAMAQNTFAVGRHIKHVSGNKEIATVLIEVNMPVLANELVNLTTDANEVYIVDRDGKIMFSFDSEQIGQPLELTATGQENIVRDQAGEQRLAVAHSSAKSHGWQVVGTVLVDNLVADARSIFTSTILIALFAAGVAALIGYIIARNIGNPLQQMTSLMEKGAEGDLSVRTTFLHRKDEIGLLAKSFNEMMEQIRSLVQQTNESAQNVLETAAKLADVSQQTAASAKEISVASEQIAGGATTLASEAERGNELTQSIGERVKMVIESNMNMGQSASNVRQSSEQGAQHMATVIDKTNRTEQMTRSMVEKVNELKESTSSIRSILEMLDNITKQTNILSLNATIEAARAGAAGRGFMVVADEIRKLADQSKESIQVVGDITDKIQAEIGETVEVMLEAYPLFQEQTESIKEADTIFRDVQEQMNSFIQDLDEVTSSVQELEEAQNVLSEAMSNVSAVSQESSATSEEVASLTVEQLNVSDGLVQLANQLEQLSQSLKESLNRFTI